MKCDELIESVLSDLDRRPTHEPRPDLAYIPETMLDWRPPVKPAQVEYPEEVERRKR